MTPAVDEPTPQLRDGAVAHPDRPAIILAGSGAVTTYAQLEARSRRLAAGLAGAGLRRADHLAILMDNCPAHLEAAWAAQRSGLYHTPINAHLTVAEVDHIVADSGAAALVVSASLAEVAARLEAVVTVPTRLAAGGRVDGYADFEAFIAAVPANAALEETEGAPMFYSSGTTGRPKGVLHALPGRGPAVATTVVGRSRNRYGLGPDTVHLCTAPLYHAAPLVRCLTTQRLGGTVVLMERFDPVEALRAIERYRVTDAQMVPTMFIRLLRLDPATRAGFDLSSLRVVSHAGGPCPVEVKAAMLRWWGPILHEYYSGTEANGRTMIGPEEWLEHPGSVGRPVDCTVHIVGESGEELPAGMSGLVYFGGGGDFAYHGDPAATAAARHPRGWTTLGDIGHLDADGYLYLTDRRDFVIVSGGVNVHPREVEDVLLSHPRVVDVAVFGVPEAEFGEQVVAVVEPDDPATAGPALAIELGTHCRARLAGYKCPRVIDFVARLPRDPSGKLRKRSLRDQYSAAAAAGPR